MEVLSSRVLIRPRDLDRSRAFYADTLGLRVYREYGVGGVATGVVFFLGGGHLELCSGGTEVPEGGGAIRLWIQVPSVDEEAKRLASLDVTIMEPPRRMPWGLDEMTIADPDGVSLVIVEVPEEHPIRRRLE